jgi:hypothetical protein
MSAGLNWTNLGASMQQIGSVLAVCSIWCVLQEESNTFFWWPMHLFSYLLTLGPIPLLIGASMLREQTVVISIGPDWIPVAVAGILKFLTLEPATRRFPRRVPR